MSRINAIDHLTIRAYSDKYSPPEKPMLQLSMVGDILFIGIIKYDETNTESKETEVANRGGCRSDLGRTLGARTRRVPLR
jgi:hypothetical protein